eukprot:10065338-Alexandrium_andersonii.AAC.1
MSGRLGPLGPIAARRAVRFARNAGPSWSSRPALSLDAGGHRSERAGTVTYCRKLRHAVNHSRH